MFLDKNACLDRLRESSINLCAKYRKFIAQATRCICMSVAECIFNCILVITYPTRHILNHEAPGSNFWPECPIARHISCKPEGSVRLIPIPIYR